MDPTLSGAGASSPSRGVHPRRALRDLFSDLDSRGIHATPRAVAVALWSHANANGGAWPSQRRLARMTGRCVRTVGAAVRELEAAGVIVRQVPELRLRRARHATTLYRLLVADAPPFVPSVPPLVEPPADLVAAVGRVAALVARDHEPPSVTSPSFIARAPEAADLDGVPPRVPAEMDTEAVEPPADAEPPLVEFLPGLLVAVDLDGVEPLPDLVALVAALVDTEAADLDGTPELPSALRPGEPPIETSTGKGFAAEDSAELPSPDLDGVPPREPPDDGTEAAPISGNGCRISETPNLPTADLFARVQRPDAAAERPRWNPARRPGAPRGASRSPPPRGGPVRAFVVPPVVSTLSTPTAGVAGAPARSTPPALAAAAARCAALTRRQLR